jgi:hypothetical protein
LITGRASGPGGKINVLFLARWAMNYERFVELFRAEPETNADSEHDIVELTLDEQQYVAGGYLKACGGFSCCHGCPTHC